MEISLFFLSIMVFVVLCLFTLITFVNKRKSFLFVFIPIILFLMGSAVYTYTELMGHPTTKDLPAKFLVMEHYIDEPNAIYLWILTSGIKEPVGYELPYSKELHRRIIKKMREAEEMGEGTQLRGKNNKFDDISRIEFDLYNFVDVERIDKSGEISNY